MKRKIIYGKDNKINLSKMSKKQVRVFESTCCSIVIKVYQQLIKLHPTVGIINRYSQIKKRN